MTQEGAADKPLTSKQRAWAEHYAAHGNATEAARQAGYKGNDNQLGVQGHANLKLPKVQEYLATLTQEAREAEEAASEVRIATAADRQAFWTAVMYARVPGEDGKELRMSDRLKASELLGKAQADFVDRHELTGKDGGPMEMKGGQLDDTQRAALIAGILERAGKGTP